MSLMVGYWAGDLPEISRLHFKSFDRYGDGWKYLLFLEDMNGTTQSDEDIRAITGDQVEIVRGSLAVMLAELGLPPIKIAHSRLITFRDKCESRLMSVFHRLTRGRLSSQHSTLAGARSGWHPKFGYAPGHTLSASRLNEDLPGRSDLFRCLALLRFPNERICYSDLDVCFTRPFDEIFGEVPLAYRWEDFANSAILYAPPSAEKIREVIRESLNQSISAKPWVMFSDQRCVKMRLQMLSLDRCDPGWAENSIGSGDAQLFFRTHELSRDFFSEVLSQNFFVHWHNNWLTQPQKDSTFDLLERYFDSYNESSNRSSR